MNLPITRRMVTVGAHEPDLAVAVALCVAERASRSVNLRDVPATGVNVMTGTFQVSALRESP